MFQHINEPDWHITVNTGMVYGVVGEGLGDCWAMLNYCYGVAERTQTKVKLSKFNNTSKRLGPITEAIAAFLHDKEPLIELTDAYPNHLIHYSGIFQAKPVPTTPSWQNLNSKMVIYQFDGNSWGHLKNPTPSEIDAWKTRMADRGYTLINVGNFTPLDKAICCAASAEYFVGVVSGMVEVCYSTGVPIKIVVNNMPKDVFEPLYYKRPFEYYSSLNELV